MTASRTQAVVPHATYRLQLHAGFGFDDAVRILPYLQRLGIGHVYCSPVLRARPGSTHGYDVVAHGEINPELGGRAGFDRFVRALREHGMGQLMDIVPNHMGVFGAHNPWWQDVLENGEASAFAGYFDIDWQPANPQLVGKVLLPVLGAPYGQVLDDGELTLATDADSGSLHLRYAEHRFPLSPASSKEVLRARDAAAAVAWFNDRAQRDALHALHEQQNYRLSHWRVAADEINYRRFFDINELAALRMESPEVFEATHGFVLDLAARGDVDGFRIDHPDGLKDPAQYFQRLQDGYAQRAGLTDAERAAAPDPARPLYVVAEKIAAPHEDVPTDWAIHGTTGYRFAMVLNGVLVDADAAERFDAIWRDFAGENGNFSELAYQGKREVARLSMASELTVLANLLLRIARADRQTRDYTHNSLRDALADIAACMPVYRTYVIDTPSAQDLRYIDWALALARRRSRLEDQSIFDFAKACLCNQPPDGSTPERAAQVRQFAQRFQQFCAPVAAKGVEDTAFYRYHRLVSLNEVGGDPAVFGMQPRGFHGATGDRAARWPHTMLATSTHDNKRAEDVRNRIDVLSEMPAAWEDGLQRWHAMAASLKASVDGVAMPSRADEYLLYQTLLGSLPAEGLDEDGIGAYRERIRAYMQKAAREAKQHTRWTWPDEAYEGALSAFVDGVLARVHPNPLLTDLTQLARTVARFGALNSLAMVLLKYTAPGVPDLYQGNELMDLSLVDPDNRRPVDYALRERLLGELQQRASGPELPLRLRDLVAEPHDGRAKLWATQRLLGLRARHPQFFREAGYEALEVGGAHARHVLAYVRRAGSDALVVVVGRLFAVLAGDSPDLPLGDAVWQDTTVALACTDTALENVLTGETLSVRDGVLRVGEAFAHWPGAAFWIRT